MAIDTRNKRGSAIGVNPLSPVLPEPDGTIGAGDRAQLAHAYSGLFEDTVVTGMNVLYPDMDIQVVKLTLRAKSGGGTATYYLGVEHFYPGNLYENSPEIHPLLMDALTTTRKIGRVCLVQQDTQVRIFAKSDFLRRGYTFADLLDQYEFFRAPVEVRYYAKPGGASTTHSDSVNIRWSGTVTRHDYDEDGGTLTLQVREELFIDKEFGLKFSKADFQSSASDELRKWVGEQIPVPFGTDPTDAQGVIVSSTPIVARGTAVDGAQYARYCCGVTPLGFSIGDDAKVYVRNTTSQTDKRPWLEATLTSFFIAPSSLPLAGPTTLVNGTEFSGKTWRFSRLLTTGSTARVISGFRLRTRRVGQITADDGKLSVTIFRAEEQSTGSWAPVDNSIGQAVVDATGISTTAGNVNLYLKKAAVLEPNTTYMLIVEWSRHSNDQKNIDYVRGSSPIEVTTSGDHGWDTGDSVTIEGVVGCTNANGTHTITKTADNKFTLDGTTGNGTSALPIVGASKRRPIVVTTGVNHGIVDGQEVQVSGVEGNTAANGTWIVTAPAANQLALLGSVGNGTYSAGGAKTITGATNAIPIVVTAASHGLEDNDIVQITGVTGNTAANGVWRITKLSSSTFSLDDSFGNGAYAGGGVVSWGGVVQVKTKAERNKYVTLHFNSAVATDPTYTNNPSVNDDGWLATAAQLQLQVFDFGVQAGSGVVGMTVGDHIVWYKQIYSSTPSNPNPIEDVDFKIGVRGIADGASTGYGGASGTLIDNPAAVGKLVLMDPVFGRGLDSSKVDVAAFNSVRGVMSSTQDMAFVVEQEITCFDLLLKLCEQARLIVYATRRGLVTIARPTYPSSFDGFRFQEGRLRGDMQLVSVENLPPSEVVNAIDATYYPDALQEVTDPYIIKTRKDQRFTGLEYVNESASSTREAQRPARAADSQALYGKIPILERYDLYYAAAPVRHTMSYKFDRYSTLPKQVTIRVPRKDFYAGSLDLLSAGTVSHTGLQSASGSIGDDAIAGHHDGTPVKGYAEGVPTVLIGCGTVRGAVAAIQESGPFLYVTFETLSPYPSAVTP